MNKLTLSMLAVLLPAALLAQDDAAEPATEEVRRYTIEVIIFRYAEDVGTGSEVFLPDVPEIPADDESPVMLDAPLPEPQEEAEPLPDIELVLLDEEAYALTETHGRLERLEAYEPLMHFGWTQSTWPEDRTEPIPLHLFGRPPAALDGSLMLYLSRFLHLVVDLELQAPEAEREVPVARSGFDGFAGDRDYREPPTPRPVWYRIQEDRILKNGELRYFDHPRFGVLARVTRVEEEQEPDPGELLGYPVQ
jgi:hypothetical protein